MRTTISIEPPLFRRIRQISAREHRPITRVIGDLLTVALRVQEEKKPAPSIKWHTQRMAPKIDYADKEDLYRILDRKS